jgi:hypothetical protein
MFARNSITLSGIIFLVLSTGLSAQTGTLNGQLLAEDTEQPLPAVAIIATSLTKPLRSIEATTGSDGRFSVKVVPGISYRLCSAATGRYAESCQFSKPVIVKAGPDMATVAMKAPAGIRIRVRIVDSDGLLRSPQGGFVAPDPLLLLVFAEETITRTRIPLQLGPSSTTASAFEASVVIPISMQWNVAMSSVRATLLNSGGNAYQSDAPISRPVSYGDGEFLAVFTLHAK